MLLSQQPTAEYECEAGSSFDEVDDRCGGESECEVSASNSVFGDPCRGTYKYLEVGYRCSRENRNRNQEQDLGAWLSKEFTEYLEMRRSLVLRRRWRSDLLVQLGSCIYGDIWEGQVDDVESGPLCNIMSAELRSTWMNIANNILQEVSILF